MTTQSIKLKSKSIILQSISSKINQQINDGDDDYYEKNDDVDQDVVQMDDHSDENFDDYARVQGYFGYLLL